MPDSGQQWNLFGYDVRHIAYYIRAGWQEFLWGDDSPVASAIDETVRAHREDGSTDYIRAGQSVAAPPGGVLSEAVVLPERLVLAKTITLPAAAEASLDSVVAMEVSASSPFPADDTCHGWRVIHRDDEALKLLLVISSQSAAMAHIAERFDSHDREAYEVWAAADGRMIMLSGFGEDQRRGRNRLRLARMAGMIGYCLALLVLLAAIAAGAKYLELQQVRETAERVQASSSEVVELREILSTPLLMIDTATEMQRQYPSPLAELERIAVLLGDDTWVSMAELRGDTLRIEGQSRDASAVMQQLLDHPAYARVDAPTAFKTVRSGMERFVLDLTLSGEVAEE